MIEIILMSIFWTLFVVVLVGRLAQLLGLLK